LSTPQLESRFWLTFTGNNDSAYTSPALAEGMRRINEVTKEVCAEEKVACLDLAPLVPRTPRPFTITAL